MTLGFSYIGLIWLVMLFVPNFIWMKNKPKDYEEYAKKENKVLLVFERAGQFIVTPAALIFSNFNIHKISFWSVLLLISFICMVIYEIFWIRYFRSEKTMKDYYRNMFGIAVPGATLPVIAFFLLGIYGGNIIMILGSVILGTGHIGIHLKHRKEAWGPKPKKKLPVRIILGFLKVIGIILLVVIFGAFAVIITLRNVNEVKQAVRYKNGINEGCYVELPNSDGYILMMGESTENPVILSLHGGPGNPTSFFEYSTTDYMTDQFTVVCWDESGCGRSYYKSLEKGNDRLATIKSQEEDLDALVDYLRNRFNQDKIIIMGHSYGTILGSDYVLTHPDKVAAYIGIGQVVNCEGSYNENYSYEDALRQAKANGDDTTELENIHTRFSNDPSTENLMELRQAIAPYHIVPNTTDISTPAMFVSPYSGVDDYKWVALEYSMMIGNPEYERLMGEILPDMFRYNLYKHSTEYQVPVLFISGSADWICPTGMVKDYYEVITAPRKDIYIIEGCGHSPQCQLPEELCGAIKDFFR